MLALDPRPDPTGLAGRNLLVGCVAESDPHSLGQALRLVQSIRWFGGELASAQVVVCIVGTPHRSARRALEDAGAEVRIVPPFQRRNRTAQQIFSEVCGTGRKLLLLGCDAVVVQDPLPWIRLGLADLGLADLGLADLGLADLGLADLGLAEMPVELDFHLDLPQPPEGYFAVDPAILRCHERIDSEGYLLHSPYPFAQVRIEAFNRRLRQEREGPAEARRVRQRPAPSAAPAAQTVVLGMHRSGTSALTALLRLLGLWAGEESDFPPADEHNQAGYWEHRGVWSVDEAILLSLKASWSEVAGLDLSRLDEGLRTRFRERARKTVRDLDRHGSWVVKDPRLCLLFPFWREVLERPVCVLIHREPLAVARSLAARDGLPIPYGIALWERYTREALLSTRGLPRILISHRELLADPEATLRRLHRYLVLHGASVRIPTQEEIRAVLDPSLVHHASEPGIERAYLTLPQLELLEALGNGTALDLDPAQPLSCGARDLLAAHQDQQAAVRGLRDRVTAETNRAASLQQAQERLLASRQDMLAAHQDVLAAHQDVLAAHQDAMAASQEALATGRAELRRALSWFDELDALFSAILDSRSWKIGRAVTGAMARLLGRSRVSAPERRDRLMDEIRRSR